MNEEVLVKTYNIDNKDYVVVNELDINNIHEIMMQLEGVVIK